MKHLQLHRSFTPKWPDLIRLDYGRSEEVGAAFVTFTEALIGGHHVILSAYPLWRTAGSYAEYSVLYLHSYQLILCKRKDGNMMYQFPTVENV